MSSKENERVDLLQGTLDLIVLQVLTTMGPQHAYGIANRVEQIAENLLSLKQGTLYPALVRLEQNGWIRAAWQKTENNRDAKYYSVSKAGKRALEKETGRWRRVGGIGRKTSAGGTVAPWPIGMRFLYKLRNFVLRRSRGTGFGTGNRIAPGLLSRRFSASGNECRRSATGCQTSLWRNRAGKGTASRGTLLGLARAGSAGYPIFRTNPVGTVPAFSLTAIFTLALGIGANTAIFSLIDALMLKSLPVSHPEQLLQVNMARRDIWGIEEPFVSNPVWEQLRDRQDVFSGLFGYAVARFDLSARGEARYVQGNYVSGQFFDTLGLRPVAGRVMTTADDRRGCPGTAVLSYGFWQSEYGGRADVAGTTISLDNHPFRNSRRDRTRIYWRGRRPAKRHLRAALRRKNYRRGERLAGRPARRMASCHRPAEARHFDESRRGAAQNAGWSDHRGNDTAEHNARPAGDLSQTYVSTFKWRLTGFPASVRNIARHSWC